jgi:uncharacterized integral membrane protein (TIGR00698 family)
LIIGILIAYLQLNPFLEYSQLVSKQLMAWSIVGLGTTVKIAAVFAVGISSFKLTVLTLLITIGGGWAIGAALGISKDLRALIASGTAICGATAIAAVGETLHAKKEEMSLALGVVLVLNGIALFLFPYLGHLLHLSAHDFGVWAGLAIHDTSSVVGAALQYSSDSVETATTVKLARALWIAPLALLFAYALQPKDGKITFKLPWFIGGFIAAAALFSFVPVLASYSSEVGFVARKGFILAIFLMGSNIDIRSLRALGVKPLLFGIILWGISSTASLFGILW